MRRLSDLGNFAADVIAGGPPAFVSWFPDGHLLTANPAFLRLAELRTEALDKLMWPEDFRVPVMATSIPQAC